MKMKIVLLVACFSLVMLSCCSNNNGASATDVGTELLRTFILFVDQPLNTSQAEYNGWTQFGSCDDQFGNAYSLGGSYGPTPDNSPILYFDGDGQVAGFGERIFGEPPLALISRFFRPVEGQNNTYDISVMFRSGSLCSSGDGSSYVLGNQLSINNNFPIELTASDAANAGWLMGDCIPKMGTHYSYDLNAPGSSTWNVSSLVPVMPMYNVDTGFVSALLFWMPGLQNIEPLGDWEGPFIPTLFCGNWCSDSGCSWDGVIVFTTMHWFFSDPSQNDCTNAKCSL